MNNEILEDINYHIENKMLLNVERNDFETDTFRGFPIKISDDFLCMTSIIDFYDEGFIIIRNKDISDAYSKEKDEFCESICINEGLHKKTSDCPVKNIQNLKNIFLDLINYNGYIIVHCERETEKCNFFLGKIKAIHKDYVEFWSLDVDGSWDEEIDCIFYNDITMIGMGDNYSKMFYKYAR